MIPMATAPQALTIPTLQPSAPEPFACVGCGAHRPTRRPVLHADPNRRPFDLIRCKNCGLVQQHPRDAAGRLAALYDPNYYVFNESHPRRWARAVQQYVVHCLPRESRRPKRLLDVGCALGHFAALARRRGWRVVGLDLSPQAVSRAAVDFALDVRAGTLAQHRTTLPPFDLVFLGDVIEHVPDPARLLQEVRAVLAPGGTLCIDTPNWSGHWRRIGRSRWLGLNRYHVNLFDAASLTALLTRCGFVDIQTGSYTHYRYQTWAHRPEIQGPLRRLPDFLAWRVNRFFSGILRHNHWSTLLTTPPATLEEAHRRVSTLSHQPPPNTTKHTADNLIANAGRSTFTRQESL